LDSVHHELAEASCCVVGAGGPGSVPPAQRLAAVTILHLNRLVRRRSATI
jgi:hypothetical protein